MRHATCTPLKTRCGIIAGRSRSWRIRPGTPARHWACRKRLPTCSRCSGSGAQRAPDATVDQARIARKTGTLHWHAGNRGEAMAAYQRALDTLSGLPAPLEAAHLYQELGLAAFRNGDNTQAVEWADR